MRPPTAAGHARRVRGRGVAGSAGSRGLAGFARVRGRAGAAGPARFRRLVELVGVAGFTGLLTGAVAGPGGSPPDPFRHLETEAGAAGFVAARNREARAFLDARADPAREARLRELLSIGLLAEPKAAGDGWVCRRRDGDQERPALVLYRRGGSRVVVDSRAGAEIDWFYPSRTGRYLAYGESSHGDEESVLRVVELATGRSLPLAIPRTRAGVVAWLPGDRALLYTRFPPGRGLEGRGVFLHRLGTPWAADPEVFDRAAIGPRDWPDPRVTADGEGVFVTVARGWSRGELWYAPLRARPAAVTPGEFRRLFGGDEARVRDPRAVGDWIYARTDRDASRWRVARRPRPRADPARPGRAPGRARRGPAPARPGRTPGASGSAGVAGPGEAPPTWTTVVPEGGSVIEGLEVVAGRLALARRRDAFSLLESRDLAGGDPRAIPLPGEGVVGGLSAGPGRARLRFAFSSVFRAPAVYGWEPATPATRPAPPPRPLAVTPCDFDAAGYVLRRLEYRSRDGTAVPMFVAHARGLRRDGNHPTLLTGYGGFDRTPRPAFTRNVLYWLERGGVYAVAGIRGGGERGEAWHRAAKRAGRPRAFEDFEAAMRALVRRGYTRPGRLAIQGHSNGGLLVGAMITRAPRRFAAAIGVAGLYDMLRFADWPPGRQWVDEYGDPADPADRAFLAGYSPYHRVVDGREYPAVLLAAGDRDARVHWAHSAKFAARLRRAQAGPQPVLFLRRARRGHGGAAGLDGVWTDYRDRYRFLCDRLGM